jgi:hypothetical protein
MDAGDLERRWWRGPSGSVLLVLLVLLLLLIAAGARAEDCPLRMVEPPQDSIARAARTVPEPVLERGLAAQDPSVRHLAVVVEWYAARRGADASRRERATEALLAIWNDYRPAARLLRIVGAGLAEEGRSVPDRAEVRRRLSQMGDRDSVLIRARELLESGTASRAQLEEALRGVHVMALVYDPEALRLAGELQAALGADQGVARMRLFRAESGDEEALAGLADSYAAAGGRNGSCRERAALLEGLFGTSASGER